MKILIIGSGLCAFNTAGELLEQGNDAILALQGKESSSSAGVSRFGNIDPAYIMTDTKIISCRGCEGDFTVLMETGGKKLSKKFSGIIIAEENEKKPNYEAYGLKPASGILPASSLAGKSILSSSVIKNIPKGGKIIFLSGIGYESNPVAAEEIMLASLKLQRDFNLQTYILTGNLKVAGNGLEKLYRETKSAGTVYFKFTDTLPGIMQDNDGKIVIELTDEITRLDFRIEPALTVVDEKISPSANMKELAAIFGLHTGPDGFLQSDNVHRTGIYTNRKGIFVTGPSRKIQSINEKLTDSANAAILSSGISDRIIEQKTTALIKSGSCVRCLTCYRCCPYRAIDLDIKPSVMPHACEGCGICFAECPRGAISLDFPGKKNVPDAIRETSDPGKASPRITAFCCSRSAARAKELSLCMGYELPDNLKVVEVPCSGFVSIEYILSAFQNKADGVLVLTCHAGNCHSEEGNIFARRRVEQLKESFSYMNIDKKRLEIVTIASNMGYEFAQIVCNFENNLKALKQHNLKNMRQ
jgi:quinone-modifying oxidoreductase, subunit QmoB